ncbi:ferrous iron transport protein B [Alkalihalobacterium bogoriense]|uniref:ferrous iron transport protein B n=1 Tax=Alkalihalobacterium bogoriense TaxID=246272 RepID=UPI00047C2E8F|nr:ferrous iron transport protein B [Alkalihalobacterium bogoriense]
MSCHYTPLPIKKDSSSEWIALVGNPNVGKSVIFHALTNIYVDVSNFPGTTLDVYHGKFNDDIIFDTPGVYGFSSFNEEEKITRDLILQADRIINVINATHLERDLFLTQQLIDTNKPILVVINMMDEAKKSGISIDITRLSNVLGVPVIPMIATSRIGVNEVKKEIKQSKPGNVTPIISELLPELKEINVTQAEKLLLLEGDPDITEKLNPSMNSYLEEIYSARREYINSIIQQSVITDGTTTNIGIILGRSLIRPLYGIPFLVFILFIMYQAIGVFVAESVVGFTEDTIMGEYYEPFIVSFITDTIGVKEQSLLGEYIVGEFGLLTMTVIYVLGLIFPLVFSFYFFLSLFEDSGYLPRLAALVDRLLQSIGLNGRAIIPMILGLGCITMATLTTRMLGSEREKRIVTFLLALSIPCSAQLAVILTLLSGVGFSYIILYFGVLILILTIVGQFLAEILNGHSTSLLLDIPPMRIPHLVNVLKKTSIKTIHFLKEATPLFAFGAIIVTTLQVTGFSEKISSMLRPLTVYWLGLPEETSNAFIMGIIRRDFGAAGLHELTLSPSQTIVSLLTITLFVPCIASVLIIFKERPKKEALLMWGSTFFVSFLVGGIVQHLLQAVQHFSKPFQVGFILFFFMFVVGISKIIVRLVINKRKRHENDWEKAA